ncbi:MAG TPA: hypothetical protein DIT97_04790 [Gimesia maris]|mgnify:CR=1 FL=1|uniref:Uncharacterized protein n=1 Tax=Gimesia maris TaxID=122 RepID=A0A3D3R2F8_9PLAN|nr:hypothetical protein [Gimesia maris]
MPKMKTENLIVRYHSMVLWMVTVCCLCIPFSSTASAESFYKKTRSLGLPAELELSVLKRDCTWLFYTAQNERVKQEIEWFHENELYKGIQFVELQWVQTEDESSTQYTVDGSRHFVTLVGEAERKFWGEEGQYIYVAMQTREEWRHRLLYLRDRFCVQSILGKSVLDKEIIAIKNEDLDLQACNRIMKWAEFPDLDTEVREYLIEVECRKLRTPVEQKQVLKMVFDLIRAASARSKSWDGTPIEVMDGMQQDYELIAHLMPVFYALPEYQEIYLPFTIELLKDIDRDMRHHQEIWTKQRIDQMTERGLFEKGYLRVPIAKNSRITYRAGSTFRRGGLVLYQEPLARKSRSEHERLVEYQIIRLIRQAANQRPECLAQLKRLSDDLRSLWKTESAYLESSKGKIQIAIQEAGDNAIRLDD